MARDLDRVGNKLPEKFWKKLRAYDEVLYVEGEERPSPTRKGVQVEWQWQTAIIEEGRDISEARPVHIQWWSYRTLGGLMINSGLRVTELMADLDASLESQKVIPGLSKIFMYDVRSGPIPLPLLKNRMTALSTVHGNVKDGKAWHEETLAAVPQTSDDWRESSGMGLFTPTSEDYELVIRAMEVGVKTDERRPVDPQE
jgi:hypothetical protein